MQANRFRDTQPELAVRRAAHAAGLRFYVARRPIPALRRTADLTFPRVKVAVFIDGCFWHGCPDHYRPALSNSAYWHKKISDNQARDIETTALLKRSGWEVLRFWEHENPKVVANEVFQVVHDRRSRTAAN